MKENYIKEYFKFNHQGSANEQATIKGEKYRITVLTSRLIRFEYDESGQFEDRPSQIFWFRKQDVPEFESTITNNILTVETQYLLIKYHIEEPYNSISLKVYLKEMDKQWHYHINEYNNLKGTTRTLDGVNGRTALENGILSKDGYATIDDSKSLVFNEHYWLERRDKEVVDLYFFGHGDSYLEAINDFYKVSGKTPLIPRYILGNWWSRYWEYSEASLKELLNTFKENQIPLSVCIIDMDWHIVNVDKKYIKNPQTIRWGYGWTGFTWEKKLFPNPQKMIQWLHDHDLKVSLNLHPADGIRPHEDCYEEVADFMGVNDMDTVPFDITDPKFVSAYFDLVLHPHEEMGIDFWWMDWQQGEKSKVVGLDPLWMLNHLHFFDSARNKDKRPFTFSRYGGPGSHRYPIGFSGDTVVTWESLDFQPYFTITASNIGYGWWSHDIGGHMGGIEEDELYTRWVQFGVFSPIMRLHSSKNPFSRREPWLYSKDVLLITRNFMQLRHQLIPYIYSMAYMNYHQHIPLIRPLYYYDKNKNAYAFENQYFFGSELLVAPITKEINEVTKRVLQKIYLPEGDYFDYFTDSYIKGGRIINDIFALQEMPVYAKAGAIIPVANKSSEFGVHNPKDLVIDVFVGEDNVFTLYEDDGISQDYLNLVYCKTEFSLKWNKNAMFTITRNRTEFDFIPKDRKYILNFHSISTPKDIILNCNEGTISYQVNYKKESNLLTIEIENVNLKKMNIQLYSVNLVKKNNLMDKIYTMLREAKVNMWKKEELYRIVKEDISSDEKINKLLNVTDVNSDMILTLITLLKDSKEK